MKHHFLQKNRLTKNVGRAKSLLGVMLALSLGLNHLAAWANPDLEALEQALFSGSYKQESTVNRLQRLEQSVFGEIQSGTESARTARLNTALKQTLLSRPASNQTTNPNADFNRPMGQNQNTDTLTQAVKPDATDYPTVTALEREVFARDFIRDDVQIRLNRLERKVFGQPDASSALADRVDRLLNRYPNVTTAAASSAPEVISVSPAVQALPSDASQFRANQRDVYSKLDALERHHFSGQTIPNGLLTERLDRLERKAYGQTFQGYSIDSRINRLLSPYQAKQNAINGNNTGNINRPDFQARPGYQTPESSPPQVGALPVNRPPQNIQIGSGFSSNSSYSFSPEMRAMLPPDIQAQMNGANTGGNGTVIGAPGTVVIERQSVSNSGFQTYGGGAPIQQYNYYNGPAGTIQNQAMQNQTMQSQTTSTVIQPNGQQGVFSYEHTISAPANGLPYPAYIGNPAFLQGLNQLEINVFQQVNTVEPVPVRLSRLESALLGQVTVGMPDQQRLETLEKTHRLQAVSKLLGQSKGAKMGRGAGSFILGVPLNGPNPLNPMGMPQPLPINPGVFGR